MSLILVTGVGGSAGRNTAAYLSENKIPFVCVDMNPDFAREHPNNFFTALPAANKSFASNLLALAKRLKVDLIIPTVEEELIPLAAAKKQFDRAGIKMVISPLRTIRICRDKYRTARILEKKGIRVPKSVLVDKIDELEKYPVIVKPRAGRGASGITIFNSKKDLLADFGRFNDSFVFQEFVNGKEYDVNMFAHDGKVFFNQVLLKTELEFGIYGNATKNGTLPVKNEAIEEFASKVSSILNFEGPVDIDIRMIDEKTPCLLEINARIGANVLKAKGVMDNLLKIGLTTNKKTVN
jgi:carbamoyl-phosphate synthase large subunit